MNTTDTDSGRPVTDQDAQHISRVEELAYELKVSEVMEKDVKTLSPNHTMNDALDLFREKHISGAPVVDGDTLIGIISMQDLMTALKNGEITTKISTYMTPKLITVSEREPLVEAIKVFVKTQIGRLPVINDEGRLVGILTKGNITRGLLDALEQDYHSEEIIRYRASHLFEDVVSDRTSLILRYKIVPRDFKHGGSASSYIKRALLRLGATPQIARRCGIAIYEAEINLIIHTTNGGTIRVEIEPHQIKMEAYDDGPGIDDIELAMTPGFSTASEEVREMGFGAGMGLANIKRCVDEMHIESTSTRGTNLHMKIFLEESEAFGEFIPRSKELAK